jgi:transcriptional regulator with XRE-family HTH domain
MTNRPLTGLRKRRDAEGWAQHELAKVIGVTQSQYHKFETGAVRLDVHRAAQLAGHLGCRIEELL